VHTLPKLPKIQARIRKSLKRADNREARQEKLFTAVDKSKPIAAAPALLTAVP